MSARTKGIVLAVLQILIVLSLGAKLLYDRSTRPRVWVLAQVYDPDLPMRGRYISQQLRMPAEGFDHPPERPAKYQYGWVRPGFWAYYQIRDGKLIASATGDAGSSGGWVTVDQSTPPQATAGEPVLLFIPDDAKIPELKRGDEMWVEVSLPKKGPPRPIRLGIKKNGVLTPLHFN